MRPAPMLATTGSLAALRPETEWAFEMKWDGLRALVEVDAGRATLISRNQIDMTVAYPEIAALGPACPTLSAVLDGEIVSLDHAGRPSFARLQKRMHVADAAAANRLARTDPAVLLVFDVLRLDGRSLLDQPYVLRRQRLEALALAGAAWQTPPAFHGSGAQAVATSLEHGLEGVVAKRLDSGYAPGRRSRNWIKIKNVRAQEVLIGGWSPGRGRRAGMIGALLVGVPEGPRIGYAGKVGTGFTDAMLRDLAADLEPLSRPDSPFPDVPRVDARDAHWVNPVLVGEVSFTEWTGDGRLRHPTWRGLRPDKSVGEVVREG
jgi:bifunctional non-homologous end joining protein LigD